MMTSNDNPSDKLERLLRAWGESRLGRATPECLSISQAAQFVRQGPSDDAQAAHVGSCPVCARLVGRLEGQAQDAPQAGAAESPALDYAPPPRRSVIALWPWLTLAAGLAIAAIGALWMMTTRVPPPALGTLSRNPAPVVAPSPASPQTAPAPAIAQAPPDEKSAGQFRELTAQVATLQAEARQAAEEHRKQLDELKRADQEQLAAEQGKVRALTAQLAEAAPLAERLKSAEQAQAALAARVDSLGKEKAELSRQVELLRVSQGELRASREAWRAMLAARPTADKTAPRATAAALAAMRSATWSANLSVRAGDLAQAVPDEKLRPLLAKLEVELTRLNLSDPNDPSDRQWMAALAEGPLLDQLNAALADPMPGTPEGGKLGEELRNVLAQAQAILLRGACAI